MISKKNFIYLGLFSACSIAGQNLQASEQPFLPSFRNFIDQARITQPLNMQRWLYSENQERQSSDPSSIKLKTPVSNLLPPPPPPLPYLCEQSFPQQSEFIIKPQPLYPQ